MAKSKRIHDLYFGVLVPTRDGHPVLVPANLFDLYDIRFFAAQWLLEPAGTKSPIRNPLSYIFFDVCGRCECEWFVSPILESISDEKIDLYETYVRPNEKLLLGMIKECSKNSARQYLREHNKFATR